MALDAQKVILLASSGAEAERIAKFCRRLFPDCSVFHSDWGQKLPEELLTWEGDLLISYCSRWIVPQKILDRAKLAINFHPAPPEFPGAGGINWALYENHDVFGVTCHKMLAKVDSGDILAIRRFPLLASDDANELYRRTHIHLEALACDILAMVAASQKLTASEERWSVRTRRRSELDEMMVVTPANDAAEILRRKRAFEFGPWKIKLKYGGLNFEMLDS